MNYSKPEVSKLDAITVIQSHTVKPSTAAFDNTLQQPNRATAIAYEADE